MILQGGQILCDPSNPEVLAHSSTSIIGDRLDRVNGPVGMPEHAEAALDCSGCLVMPGLVNAHTHCAMSLLRGVADDLPLDRWLSDYIFPSEAKHAGPDFVYLGTLVSAAEMALSGVTTFADGYYFMEQAAKAAVQVGIRAVIAQGVLDVPTPDAPSPGLWRDRAERFLDQCESSDLIIPALFCHSPYLCSPATILDSLELMRSRGGLLFCHVAETAREVHDVFSLYGRRPLEHLHSLGVLGPGFVSVHDVHLSESEKDLLAKTGTPVVHCPESNMKLASGACDCRGLVARGVTVALGTDGPASNNNLDMFEEMRSASLMAKLVSEDPQALDARTVIRMATVGGALALGMADRIGTLKPGMQADLIVLDTRGMHWTPAYDLLSHLVYSARGSDVRHVIAAGKLIVKDGKLATVDEELIKQEAQTMADRIRSDLSGGR